MLLYAEMLIDGYGVKRDMEEAKVWLVKCTACTEDAYGSVATARAMLRNWDKVLRAVARAK